MVLFISWLSIFLVGVCFKERDSLKIKEIKPIEATFLPVYI
jgi:hypothetical protein